MEEQKDPDGGRWMQGCLFPVCGQKDNQRTAYGCSSPEDPDKGIFGVFVLSAFGESIAARDMACAPGKPGNDSEK